MGKKLKTTKILWLVSNKLTCDLNLMQLLSKPKFSAIEKMKTVGSTYMAAAGLEPGRDMGNNDETYNHNAR